MSHLRYTFLLGFFLMLNTSVLSEFNLTIVHINDFHSHWLEFNDYEKVCSEEESTAGKCYGGFPRIITAVRELRKKERNVLLLSSGEFFYGNSYQHLHGYKLAKVLLPKLGINAMSLSNHDFDSGKAALSAFLYNMEFPILCANMVTKKTSFLHSRVNRSAVLNVGGQKIGIIGYTNPGVLEKFIKVTSVKFFKELPAVKNEAIELVSKGINKIIALGHSGYETDLQIATEVKDVDIVIGSNSNIVIEKRDTENEHKIPGNIYNNYPRLHYHREKPEIVQKKDSLILQIPQHGKYLGIVRVKFDKNGNIVHESGEAMFLDKGIAQDPETLSFLKDSSETLETLKEERYRFPVTRDQILAVLEGDLDGNVRLCRRQECTLGNFVTDAMIYSYDKSPEEKGEVDAVVINSGIILHSIQAGNLTLRDLYHALICGDQIMRTHITGYDLKHMMEISVRDYDPSGVSSSGAFLQMSGLKVEYDLSKPKWDRVKSLFIRDRSTKEFQPVKPYEHYYIAMPSFIRMGHDGYQVYEQAESEHKNSAFLGQSDVMLILDYLKDNPVIKPKLDFRITFYDIDNKSDFFNNPPVTTISDTTIELNHMEQNGQKFQTDKTENMLFKSRFNNKPQSTNLSQVETHSKKESHKSTLNTQNITNITSTTTQMPILKTEASNINSVAPDYFLFENFQSEPKEVKTSSFDNENHQEKINQTNYTRPEKNETSHFFEHLEAILLSAVLSEVKKAKELTEEAFDCLEKQLTIHFKNLIKLEADIIPATELYKMSVTNRNMFISSSESENSETSSKNIQTDNNDRFQIGSTPSPKNEERDRYALETDSNNFKSDLHNSSTTKNISDVTKAPTYGALDSHNIVEDVQDLCPERIVKNVMDKVRLSLNVPKITRTKLESVISSGKNLHRIESVSEIVENVITEATHNINKIKDKNVVGTKLFNTRELSAPTENTDKKTTDTVNDAENFVVNIKNIRK